MRQFVDYCSALSLEFHLLPFGIFLFRAIIDHVCLYQSAGPCHLLVSLTTKNFPGLKRE